jgi:hypothetical protein
MKILTPAEAHAIRQNLFPESANAALNRINFPWHRHRGEVTAVRRNSSQALAIDVFGVLDHLEARSKVIDAWLACCGLSGQGPWTPFLERPVPRDLLGEPLRTQIDVSLESATALVLIECKFTEADGGCCSQPRRITGKSAHRGLVQCSGEYINQINPVNNLKARCALTAKGIHYWAIIPRVLSIRNDADARPCPFSGSWYQWMRNLVACQAMCDKPRKRGAFMVVYPEGPFPMAWKVASPEWRNFVTLSSKGEIRLVTVSYQQLIGLAVENAEPRDREVLERLRNWVLQKIGEVARTC